MSQKQIPKEKKHLVIKYYQQGQTYAEIASKLKISRSSISYILTNNNIKFRGHTQIFIACGSKNGKAKLSESQVRQIRQLSNLGVTRKEIAKQFDVSRTTIDRIINYQSWRHIGPQFSGNCQS